MNQAQSAQDLRTRLKAAGATDQELAKLDLEGLAAKGVDFNKLIAFIAGLVKLVNDTFGQGSTGGDGGGIFGAQMAPGGAKNAEKLAQAGIPTEVARLGWGNLLNFIQIAVQILSGLGNVLPKQGDPGTPTQQAPAKQPGPKGA